MRLCHGPPIPTAHRPDRAAGAVLSTKARRLVAGAGTLTEGNVASRLVHAAGPFSFRLGLIFSKDVTLAAELGQFR